MSQSRTSNAKTNAVSGLINLIVTLAIPFIVRTVLLRKLGAEYLGLNSLFTSILQVLNMAELGFSSAVTFSLYKPLAEHDNVTVCAYLTYFKKVYEIIGMVVIVAGTLLLPFIPYLVKGSYPAGINIYIIFGIYILNTSFSYLFWGYKTVLLSALQKSSILSNIATILTIFKSALQILALLVLGNFYFYVLSILLITIINNITVKYIVDRFYPAYLGRGELKIEQKKIISKQVGGLAIGKISNTARNSFDSIVLAMFFGLVDSAIYSNYYYIVASALALITVLTNAIAAGIGDSVATETPQKNYKDFKKFYVLFTWIGAWCTISMVCLYQPFMELWVGDKLVVSEGTMFMFVVYFYILQSGQFRAVYTRACGIWWELRYLTVAEAFSNLLLNFILGYYFGMKGILIATIVTVFLFSIVGVGKMTINQCFKMSAIEFFITSGVYAVITAILATGTYLLVSAVEFNGFIGLIIKAGLCFVVPNVVILVLIMMNRTTRTYIIEIKNRLVYKEV